MLGRWSRLVLASMTVVALTLPATAGPAEAAFNATPGRVIRTISFRTTAAWATPGCTPYGANHFTCYPTPRAGRYVSVANGIRMYVANTAAGIVARDAVKPVNVSFGVFAAGNGMVRLLAPNGLWVRLVYQNGARVAVASGRTWSAATPLKIKTQPRENLAASVIANLTRGPDPTPVDGLVCITAFDSSARRLGLLLTTAKQPKLRLARTATCGSSTATLFNTDLPQGASATTALTASQRDPLLDIRFVPPDRPARSFPNTALGRLRLRVAVQGVQAYFASFERDLTLIQINLGDQYSDIERYLMWDDPTFVPPTPSKNTTVTTQVIGAVSGVAGWAVPQYKAGIAAAGALLTLLTSGVNYLGERADASEPRLLELVRNNVAETVVASMNKVQDDFLRLHSSVDTVRDRITAGCEGGYDRCVSQRALAVWEKLNPVYPTQDARWDAVYAYVAGLERQAWLDILPSRAVMYADVGQGLGPERDDACEVYVHPDRPPGQLYAWLAPQDMMPTGTARAERDDVRRA